MKRTVTGIETRTEQSFGGGFLRLETLACRNLYDDGGTSREYRSEVLHRRGFDSVAILPWWFEESPRRLMVLVALGIRLAPWLRRSLPVPAPESGTGLYTIEAIAGSLEPGDRGEEGIDRRAARELEEEAGFSVRPGDLERLGAGFLPSHGQSTEKVHLRAARVDPAARRPARGDGSVGEADSRTQAFEASDLLAMCLRGEAEDPKIEIGLRRLCGRVGFDPGTGAWRGGPAPAAARKRR